MCNLRAYLVAVDTEPALETEDDIINYNRRLFLPSGTIFAQLYRESDLEVRKRLYAQVESGNQWFRYRYEIDGLMEKSLQLDLMAKGDAYVCTSYMARYSFPSIERRHGFQPFRVGRNILFARYGGIVGPKLSPWKHELDRHLLRLIEGGVNEQILRSYVKLRFLKENDVDLEDQDKGNLRISMEHLVIGILAWLVGIGASVIAFSGEIALTKFDQSIARRGNHFKTLSSFN